MALLLACALTLGCGGSGSALVTKHGGYHLPSPRRNSCRQADHRHHPSPTPWPATSLFSATSSAEVETYQELAHQLLEENSMPPAHDGHRLDSDLERYDEDPRTPVESEFLALMTRFLAYSERDVQSLTTTSTRYPATDPRAPTRPRTRSREEGVRYRALYSGVRAASLEPEVRRSFAVLFEDYLPVRLAGRRIFAHLTRVMEEVREERAGEIAAAREACPGWDRALDGGEDAIEYARDLWDAIMDEALLQESSESHERCQEGGAMSFSQLRRLGLDRCLVREGLVGDAAELERIVQRVALQEETDIEERYVRRKERNPVQRQEHGALLQVTFVTFMKVLCQCASQREYQNRGRLLRGLEEQVAGRRTTGAAGEQDAATRLAARAIDSGGQRRKHSARYDGYVAQFKAWEGGVLGGVPGDDRAAAGRRQSRRRDILRGCFVGARNPRVVAALKIVYVDYAALRVAGDLVFRLVSKVVK